jgi:hypothetical protein
MFFFLSLHVLWTHFLQHFSVSLHCRTCISCPVFICLMSCSFSTSFLNPITFYIPIFYRAKAFIFFYEIVYLIFPFLSCLYTNANETFSIIIFVQYLPTFTFVMQTATVSNVTWRLWNYQVPVFIISHLYIVQRIFIWNNITYNPISALLWHCFLLEYCEVWKSFA